MPFPPTKIQLSLKPNVLITELPSSEIRCLASSLSLQEKEDGHYFNIPQCSQHYRFLTIKFSKKRDFVEKKSSLGWRIIERSHQHNCAILDFLEKFNHGGHIYTRLNVLSITVWKCSKGKKRVWNTRTSCPHVKRLSLHKLSWSTCGECVRGGGSLLVILQDHYRLKNSST